MISESEVWQVEVNGQIYEANFDELVEWIFDGAVLRQDRVRRGNLRWLEAGKIPKLVGFFNQKDLNMPPPTVPSVNQPVAASEPPSTSQTFNVNPADEPNFAPDAHFSESAPVFDEPVQIAEVPHPCRQHPEAAPAFVCDDCAGQFCAACPKCYGGTVRTCPLCGGLCRAIAQLQAAAEKNQHFQRAMSEGFGFNDFSKALAYPWQYKTSLISGGVMFMLFTLGQTAMGFGGLYMMFAGIFCLMLSNMLTFGILANTVSNFSQGATDRNFMPNFDDFELWNDVIHPFFLSIGVYIVSFGLFIALIIGMVWYLAGSFAGAMVPNEPAAENMIPDSERIPGAFSNDPINSGQNSTEELLTSSQDRADREEAEIQDLQKMIEGHRQNQLESVVGRDPQTNPGPMPEMFGRLLKVAVPFLLLSFAAIIWGLFYLPAACLVAGYSRSFAATINPVYGLDTIKRLGVDYLKILGMCLLISIFMGGISSVLHFILSPFDMPMVGNLPATALGSLATFYFSIVFSAVLGYALYKNSEKFNFYRR